MSFSNIHSEEENLLHEYLSRSSSEIDFSSWCHCQKRFPSLILAEGFEERSLGLLERFSAAGIQIPSVVIGRYVNNLDLNANYRKRFELAAERVAPDRWSVVENHNDGEWVRKALEMISTDAALLDITAISNRGLFNALDSLVQSKQSMLLGYTEAAQYWPKHADWERLKKELNSHSSLAEIVDKKPWLFGYEHKVELVPDHEGYDSAGSSRALIAFLPYKRARLAAILKEWEYADFLFIAGRPHLAKNAWRSEALKEINGPLTNDWPILEVPTFGYRETIPHFVNILFVDQCFMHEYDVHLGILGSKLQNLACWVVSCMLPALTIVTSVPEKYYPEAFSEGIGMTWVIHLASPYVNSPVL